jgi:hypothetical protein
MRGVFSPAHLGVPPITALLVIIGPRTTGWNRPITVGQFIKRAAAVDAAAEHALAVVLAVAPLMTVKDILVTARTGRAVVVPVKVAVTLTPVTLPLTLPLAVSFAFAVTIPFPLPVTVPIALALALTLTLPITISLPLPLHEVALTITLPVVTIAVPLTVPLAGQAVSLTLALALAIPVEATRGGRTAVQKTLGKRGLTMVALPLGNGLASLGLVGIRLRSGGTATTPPTSTTVGSLTSGPVALAK